MVALWELRMVVTPKYRVRAILRTDPAMKARNPMTKADIDKDQEKSEAQGISMGM